MDKNTIIEYLLYLWLTITVVTGIIFLLRRQEQKKQANELANSEQTDYDVGEQNDAETGPTSDDLENSELQPSRFQAPQEISKGGATSLNGDNHDEDLIPPPIDKPQNAALSQDLTSSASQLKSQTSSVKQAQSVFQTDDEEISAEPELEETEERETAESELEEISAEPELEETEERETAESELEEVSAEPELEETKEPVINSPQAAPQEKTKSEVQQDSPSIMTLLDGIELPHGLVSYTQKKRSHAIFITSDVEPIEAGTAFADELASIGYKVRADGTDRAIATRGNEVLSMKIEPDANKAQTAGAPRYKDLADNSVAIEVWVGNTPRPKIST